MNTTANFMSYGAQNCQSKGDICCNVPSSDAAFEAAKD
jgi:hypothetical protein